MTRDADALAEPAAPSRTLAWENAYEGGARPTWETGQPQPAVIRAAGIGLIRGDVLDVGCGTGVHARMLAERGYAVTGIDFATRAIERALAGPPTAARFAVADACALADAGFGPGGLQFDTVLDVGCFHTIQPADRPAFAASVGGALRPGGHLVMVCWSDANPFGFGPSRISREEIQTTFVDGWIIETIQPSTLDTLMAQATVMAWLAVLRRT